jgi:2,4-dienoyl-CoA reductase-like NADH-dependent reductase (Old Yellow Enzyme family)
MTALSELAASGSANGTQLWVQLGHAGRQATAKVGVACWHVAVSFIRLLLLSFFDYE